MRTFKTGHSRRVAKWKCKPRRSFRRFSNRRKLSRVCQSMNVDRNVGNSAQTSDVISLIDDDENIASESTVANARDVPREDDSTGHRRKCRSRRGPRIEVSANTSIVDLSSDQEQPSFASQMLRVPKRKRTSIALGGGDEVAVCKKFNVNKPATIVNNAGGEVKILGLDTGDIPSVKCNANEVVVLRENSGSLLFLNSCSLKTEAANATCSVEKVQDKPTSPDSTGIIPDHVEINDSVLILDSDDECPIIKRPKLMPNYIPFSRKRLDTSVEILDHVLKVPQSPELQVVKHIHPLPQTSTKQNTEEVVMFEDRTGSFDQFYNTNFWKNLKNRKEQHQLKPKARRDEADAEQQPKPVKQRDDSNIYNPSPVFEIGGLRPIIIDGNNVAWGHGNHNHFSAPGLEICINYFSKRKHRVIAFVPQYRKTKKVPGLIEMLDKYEKLGQIVITPSRKIDGKTVSSYDDRYIVQAATELGGVIVSTDNYRDLMPENQRWKETIEKRLLMFTWVGDMLMFPQDPLGRDGPTLEEFLRFPG